MAPRRSHQKSRRGCSTCKRRHVKCDEKGPPCGPCKARATVCDYTDAGTISQTPSTTESATSCEPNPGEQNDMPIYQTDLRLLEMQLMSRWSAITYKSMCTKIVEDDHVWQIKIPKLALQHDFILHSLFALTAFEIASSVDRDRDKYADVACKYQDQAVASFRKQLMNINQDSFEAVVCASMMLMILALASSLSNLTVQNSRSNHMVQTTITHFELLRGCDAVLGNAEDKERYIAENQYIQKATRFEDLARTPLDPRVAAALRKLTEFNERRITSSVAESYERRLEQVSHWKTCKTAIENLRDCFEKCVGLDYQGYALGWLNISGDEYIDAIRADDEPALLILMVWGALVERIGHQVWWARDFGSSLIQEISEQVSHKESDKLVTDIVTMAREVSQLSTTNGIV